MDKSNISIDKDIKRKSSLLASVKKKKINKLNEITLKEYLSLFRKLAVSQCVIKKSAMFSNVKSEPARAVLL